MNQDLLYVLTGRGLEMYTSRCGAVAVHHTDRFNTKEKVNIITSHKTFESKFNDRTWKTVSYL